MKKVEMRKEVRTGSQVSGVSVWVNGDSVYQGGRLRLGGAGSQGAR